MTYPSPYQPPTQGYYGYTPTAPDLGRHARWAGLLMIILGIVGAVFAACSGIGGMAMQNEPQMRSIMAELEKDSTISYQTRMAVGVAVIAIPAFVFVLLGLFVRKGRSTAIVLSIIVVALVSLLILLAVAASLLAASQGMVQGVIAAAIYIIMLVPMGLCLFWLAKAIANVGPLKAFNEHHQAYQWQMAEHARAQQAAYYQQYAQQQSQQQGQIGPPPPPPPPAS